MNMSNLSPLSLTSVQLAVAAMFAVGAAHAASVGKPAPDFTLTDVNGKKVSLSDFKGKTVVLEWHNPACPFVVKHYDSNNMQNTQKKNISADTVWLAVNSTNPKHQDFMANDKLSAYSKDKGMAATAYLVDADGKVGNAYAAKTTPHMYIIDAKGTLVYNGAIDDKKSSNKADIPGAKNFVNVAFDELKAGKPISNASNAPYGCSVKYS
jgi:peroxiredoxin